MTHENLNLTLNLKVANKLVNTLQLLDGRGYDRMGNCSQDLLIQLSEKGSIIPSFLKGYLRDFQDAYETLEWINAERKAEVEQWIVLIEAYAKEQSEKNAQTLLDF